MTNERPRLILASGSPRRRELLAKMAEIQPPVYHSPFKPFGSYPYRRAVLAMGLYGEHCSPVRWFSRKGEW